VRIWPEERSQRISRHFALPLVLTVSIVAAACVAEDSESTSAVETSAPVPVITATPTTTIPPGPLSATDVGLPWWNDRVFYEVFVRSFADSDAISMTEIPPRRPTSA